MARLKSTVIKKVKSIPAEVRMILFQPVFFSVGLSVKASVGKDGADMKKK